MEPMGLFHPRVLSRDMQVMGDIAASKCSTLAAWASSLAQGVYDSETQNDAEFIQRILIDVLGYVGSSSGAQWTVAKNQPVGTGNVDVALGHFGVDGKVHIAAPFELKGARTKDLDAVMPGRSKSPVQQAWEYAMDAKGAKWVLVSNYRDIRLYAVGFGRKDYESFDLLGMSEPSELRRFLLLLSADNLLGGHTLQLLKDSEATEKDITKQLYAEYKATRTGLIKEVLGGIDAAQPLKAVRIAQTILDRVLFIAFAEDKGLLTKGTLKDAYTTKNHYSPQPAWENFKGLFNAIDKGNPRLNIPGYNGGLFAHDDEIDALAISEETCKCFAGLGEYDYDSEVSVNILGHVFEQSIADIEEIKRGIDPDAAPLDEVSSKRRTDGIFYTPPFITRHIVEQAVGKWLADRKAELGFDIITPLVDEDYESIKLVDRGRNKGKVVSNANVKQHIALWEAYKSRLSSIRVIDPACGSGAFLNEVFDFLFREGQVINRTLETFYGGQGSLFRWDTHILANNIYGVDINRESVEITKLSLWLKTANRNEKLSYLDDNIKTGNSLIKDRSIAGALAFDWGTEFAEIMASGRFDVVVGNPPYVDSEAMAKYWAREREYISSTFSQTKGNWDLYVAFLELGCNLLSETGYLAFITPDKWISKDFGVEIRKRVLPGLVSILPVGRGVFESALVDSIITTISRKPVSKLQSLSISNGEIATAAEIDKAGIDGEQGFDQLLSPHLALLQKIERACGRFTSEIATAENACATSDTYVLGEILTDAGSAHAFNPALQYRVANTGTLVPFGFRWGSRPMRYLKNDYLYPVVNKADFRSRLGATYRRRAASPKLIIKGLTLLDGALDLVGAYVPGKSTIVFCSQDFAKLKLLAGVINSRLASFYVKQKYASASYNGGVNFTPDMLNSIPLPQVLDEGRIIEKVDVILHAQAGIADAASSLFAAIRASSPEPSLRRQFDDWHGLSTPEFISELLRQGLTLSLHERAEWAELFESSRARANQHVKAYSVAKGEIDEILFDACGLDEDDKHQLL
jgi:hypothetical protein